VQRGVTGAAHCILSKGDSQRRNFWLVIDAQNRIDFRWETSGGGNHGTTSSTAITDAAWHHVACVYDQAAGQNRIYRDGVLLKSSTDSGTPTTSTDPVHIGARLSSGSLTNYFRGAIDLVRVSAGALYTSNFTPPTAFGSGPPQTQVQLAWQPPASGPPAGYNVYRQVNGGGFTQLNAGLVTSLAFNDTAPVAGSLCYQVTAVDAVPQEGPASAPACVTVVVAKVQAPTTSEAVLSPRMAASPNPFNPATSIAYRLPTAGYVNLAIYDVTGRRVATLVAENRAAGEHTARWSGHDDSGRTVASGAYFAVLDAGSVHLRKKLLLVK
jgi:hypothetical protein